MNCDTCHWKMKSDGRCLRGQSPNSCSEYMMNDELRRVMEQQEREQKERKRQEWLKTDEGKKWQVEENRKKEEERLEKERKERERQEWLKTEEGQKWQANKIEEQKKNDIKSVKNDLKVIYIGGGIGALIGAVIGYLITKDISGIFLGVWAGLGIGGNIILVIELFIMGIAALFDGCFTFILVIFLGIPFLGLTIIAFIIAGPIWPLIRIILKNIKLKKM